VIEGYQRLQDKKTSESPQLLKRSQGSLFFCWESLVRRRRSSGLIPDRVKVRVKTKRKSSSRKIFGFCSASDTGTMEEEEEIGGKRSPHDQRPPDSRIAKGFGALGANRKNQKDITATDRGHSISSRKKKKEKKRSCEACACHVSKANTTYHLKKKV